MLTFWFIFTPLDGDVERSPDQQPADSATAHNANNANLILFFINCFRVRLFRHLPRVNSPARHPILFVSPAAKVDQFAALRAKRTPRIVLPFDGFVTCRTLGHNGKLRSNLGNVKRFAIAFSRVSGEIFIGTSNASTFFSQQSENLVFASLEMSFRADSDSINISCLRH